MRVCYTCKIGKPLLDFYKGKCYKDGYDIHCKTCARKRKHIKNLSPYAKEMKHLRDKNRLVNNLESERKRKLEVYHRYKNTPKWRANKSRVEAKRRSYMKTSINDLTGMDIIELLAIQENKCAACGIKFTKNNRYTVDHIVPVSKGGNLTFDNTQLLCKHCNCSKGAKTIIYRKM
jgi:5-methylcytosine-specific restriction endonuclease McrA